METNWTNSRRWLVAGAIAAGAGLGAFGIAGAATSTTTSPAATTPSTNKFQGHEDPTHEKGESTQREADEKAGKFGFGGGHGGAETTVTGTTADKIKAAALAAVPGATVDKTEQHADGSYEAEITKADGSEAHVQLDKNFVVTSTDSGGHHGPGDAGTQTAFGA